MKENGSSRGGLKRLFARYLFAGAFAVPTTAAATPSRTCYDDVSRSDDDECDDHCVESAVESLVMYGGGGRLVRLLESMTPFDATRTAALAAISPNVNVRWAIADALASRFPLVGDDLVLDQLRSDPDPNVRDAAARAANTRALRSMSLA
jgi:hypothetical protein